MTFHTTDDDSESHSGLDIASVGATPRLGHREALVEGSPAVVLSTTQILTAKLQHRGKATLRDAVDFDHAARRDPDSLTFAINTLSNIESEGRRQKFRLAATEFTTTDDRVIRQMHQEHRPDQSTLGQAVADTIQGLRYADVSIKADKGICHFEATTRNKHSIHVQCRGNDVDRTFGSIGVDEYLHATLKDADEVRKEVRQACRDMTLTTIVSVTAKRRAQGPEGDEQRRTG